MAFRKVAAVVALAAGSVQATPVEVVVSHFDEDLDWLSKLETESGEAPKVSVYSKGENAPSNFDVQRLPNVGREAHSYLSHIVKNYDKLADWTVFTQGGAPSFGYQGHANGGGHLMAGDKFTNYLTPDPSGSRFIYTSTVHLPTMHHSLRTAYAVDDAAVEGGAVAACPADASKWTQWWDASELKDWIMEKAKQQGGEEAIDFYKKYINPSHKGDELTLSFPQGARFALSKEKILSRTKEEYERLLELFSKDADPYAGYFMEWMWSEFFLGHGDGCAVREHKSVTSHQNALEDAVSKYVQKPAKFRFLSASGTTDSGASRQHVMSALAVAMAAAVLY